MPVVRCGWWAGAGRGSPAVVGRKVGGEAGPSPAHTPKLGPEDGIMMMATSPRLHMSGFDMDDAPLPPPLRKTSSPARVFRRMRLSPGPPVGPTNWRHGWACN